ncbi:MAG: GNAT family N-acetyltransferase [Alphaproteobacteria bacterium]|nr:GNAT family N-acetyltransferase [Alphaproteobacteria bacterium]
MTRLETEQLVLTELDRTHASGPYLAWMNDPELMQFLESRFRNHTADDLAAFIESTNADPNQLLLGMFAKDDDSHVGNIKIGPIDRHHARGDIGLLIGDRSRWGSGLAREAIDALSRHALEDLGLHKVTAGCYGANIGARKAFLAAGFTEEGRRPEHFRHRDGWQDHVLLCRFA